MAQQDSEWLKSKLVGLLEDAADRDPPDHAACAKYADLLWKMLPKGTPKDKGASLLDRVRQAITEGQAPEK